MIRFSDVRYALRLWRRHPTMIAVAGLSLGLGVGATTTMYSVVNRVAHYDLGFADEGRLVVVWRANPERGNLEQPLNWLIVRGSPSTWIDMPITPAAPPRRRCHVS